MEIWKEIEGYEGLYKISNLGNVLSIKKNIILKPDNVKGYHRVALRKNKIKKRYMVHRLVGAMFIPNINNKPFINHKNGIKNDNKVDNLEWCTPSENTQHMWDNNLCLLTEKQKDGLKLGTKKNEKRIFGIVNDEIIFDFISMSEAERQTGIYQANISKCCLGKIKTSGKYKGIRIRWKYAKDVI